MLIALAVIVMLVGTPGDGETVAGELRAQAVAFVKAQLASMNQDMTVECGYVPATLSMPQGERTISFDPIEREKLRGTAILVAHIAVGHANVANVMVPVTVRTYSLVPISTRGLEKHGQLKSGDLSMQRKEMTSIRETPFVPKQDVAYRLKQMLPAGFVVYTRMVEEIPLIVQGEPITLVAQSGGVKLSTQGIAKEDGWEGSSIIVQKAGTRDRVRARVIGSKTAVVLE